MRRFKALRGVGACAGVFVAMGLVLLMASGATAASPKCLVVGAGGSYGTLQAAVNAASAGDTLKVKGTCYGDTTISKSLTIIGQSNPGFGPATLNGGNNELSTGSVVTIDEGVTAAITGLTVTGGFGEGGGIGSGGGGIYNAGSLTLIDSTVSGNRARVSGGIDNRGSLTLSDSTVSNNTALGAAGILNERSLTLKNSTVSDNRVGDGGGGGISSLDGSLIVNNSTVTGNDGLDFGGGMSIDGGSATVTYSTVSGNLAQYGGAIDVYDSSVTLENSTITDNTACCGHGHGPRGSGGGISVSDASLAITNSTVSGNRAFSSGGISIDGGSAILTDSTISDNNANYAGGIGNAFGSLTLINSSVTRNTATEGFTGEFGSFGGEGGGIYSEGSLTFDGSSSVTENTAVKHGGGIFNEQAKGATITYGTGWSGTVSGNKPDDIFNF
jgi:hypothetical protein